MITGDRHSRDIGRENRPGAVKSETLQGNPENFAPSHVISGKEVKEMIDIQDIEVMAEALTCGSYNKG
ncbi:hypothetical protein AB0892_14160 [Streptomyces sp. NPDC005409]|uniref:hypothetical protein n=1 Tax=Streptomyces sp. NPDC005409 TaxID=3155342 RepID=UPI0034523492